MKHGPRSSPPTAGLARRLAGTRPISRACSPRGGRQSLGARVGDLRRWWGSLTYRLRHLLRGNSRAQAKRNVHAHYDLGNAFYALRLDGTMTYPSGMFEGRMELGLEEAQAIQYERILAVRDRLKRGGRALIQTISIADRLFARYRTGTDFIQQYIFPGGMLP